MHPNVSSIGQARRQAEDLAGQVMAGRGPVHLVGAGSIPGSARHRSGWQGSLRVQRLGDRPAVEGESLMAEGFTGVGLGARYRWRSLELELSVANLLDAGWREAQFANESRLTPTAEVREGIHFVPGTPLLVQGGLRVYF